MDEYYTWDVGSVWQKSWPEFMYICQCPIFHGLVILPYILKTNAITGILVPCDAKIYLITCMWVSDLHFMVQWFCLISGRVYDGLMLYWRYWFSVKQTLNWNYICRSVMDKCHYWNIWSTWCKDLPKNVCGAVTYISWSSDLSYILKTTWWMNVALQI